MKPRGWFPLCLLLAAPVLAMAAPAGKEIDPGSCKMVSGTLNLSADDGMILWNAKEHYQVNDGPEALKEAMGGVTTLTDGASGTFKICALQGHDRFGSQIVNIASYKNLSLNPPPS